jgi:hypothetical protein
MLQEHHHKIGNWILSKAIFIAFISSVKIFAIVFIITLYIQSSAGKQSFHPEYGTNAIMHFTLHGV